MEPSRERAKEIVVEIVRQAGAMGQLKLYKTYWLAHLYYYQMAPGFLSDWAVVRSSRGPGIDQGSILLAELEAEGCLTLIREPRGPFTEICCRPGPQATAGNLPELARQAIARAVEFIKPLSAGELTALSHDFSRSWGTASNGEELDIYTDLLPDEEYEPRSQEMAELARAYGKLVE